MNTAFFKALSAMAAVAATPSDPDSHKAAVRIRAMFAKEKEGEGEGIGALVDAYLKKASPARARKFLKGLQALISEDGDEPEKKTDEGEGEGEGRESEEERAIARSMGTGRPGDFFMGCADPEAARRHIAARAKAGQT